MEQKAIQNDAIMNAHMPVSSLWERFSLGYPSVVLLGYTEHESPTFHAVTLLVDILPALFRSSYGTIPFQYLALSEL